MGETKRITVGGKRRGRKRQSWNWWQQLLYVSDCVCFCKLLYGCVSDG